jgi:type IV secretory pathway TrbL component
VMDLIILFIKFGLGGFWLGVRASEVRIDQNLALALGVLVLGLG